MKHAELHENLVVGDTLLFDPMILKKEILFDGKSLTELTEFRFLGFTTCGGMERCFGCKGFMNLERIDNGDFAEKCWRWQNNTVLIKYEEFLNIEEMEI